MFFLHIKEENPFDGCSLIELIIPNKRRRGDGLAKICLHDIDPTDKDNIPVVQHIPDYRIVLHLRPEQNNFDVSIGHANIPTHVPFCSYQYELANDFNWNSEHKFEIHFSNWMIEKVVLDEKSLLSTKELQAPLIFDEGRLAPSQPAPEIIGTLQFVFPIAEAPEETRKIQLDQVFDFSKEFVFWELEQGNSTWKVYRDIKKRVVFSHTNPSTGTRILSVKFSDVPRANVNVVLITLVWSPARNYMKVFAGHKEYNIEREAEIHSPDFGLRFRTAITEFEKLLKVEQKEEVVHQFLKNNGTIFAPTSLIPPVSKYKLGKKLITDFVIKELGEGYIFIEIEKPGMRFFTQKKKDAPFERHHDLGHAIEQIEHWRAWIQKNQRTVADDFPDVSAIPMCWIIGGRKKELNAKKRQRLAEINNEHRHMYKIMSYDDILHRAKNILKNFTS